MAVVIMAFVNTVNTAVTHISLLSVAFMTTNVAPVSSMMYSDGISKYVRVSWILPIWLNR